MGTNYYLHKEPVFGEVNCVHIGKSSAGWCFALRVYPEYGIHDIDDWLPLFRQFFIYDEYGDPVSVDEMILTIANRRWRRVDRSPEEWERFHKQNYSQPGPNNLVRCKIDGTHCVGHGLGTWDLFEGSFR